MGYGLNRYLCDVLAEMRTCSETKNYAYLPSLVEEIQTITERLNKTGEKLKAKFGKSST